MSPPESTSLTLIARAAAGSREDREAFARIYGPVILAYLSGRWRGSIRADDLDDALQEVFVDCFRVNGALARLDATRPLHFRPYLRGITRNVALRFESRAARHGPTLDPAASAFEHRRDDDTPSRIFDRAWAQAILREALERLIAEARVKGEAAVRRVQLLEARFEDDQPIRRIAERWDVDAARLHKQYAQARVEFVSALKATLADHRCGSSEVTESDLEELLELLGPTGT